MTQYPNLTGVFAREFPVVTARVAGTSTRERVVWHRQHYDVVGDPNKQGRYAFDVILRDEILEH